MAETVNQDGSSERPPGAGEDHPFLERVTRFFNGPLEEGDLEALTQRLKTDPSARRVFVEIATVDGLMTERSLESRHGLSISADLLEESAAADASQLSLHDATVLAAIREEDISTESDESITLSPQVTADESTKPVTPILTAPWIIKISAAAAVVLLGTLIAFWALRTPHHQITAIGPASASASGSVQGAQQSSSAICLGAAVRPEWDSDSPSPALGDAIPNVPLHLRSGWVRLDFPSGVTAVVEAPARFQVQSRSKVSIELGRISADVPVLGHGFSIQSPTCQVVDLGTDFGMSVTEQGQSEVQVFKGKVSFSRTNSLDMSPPQILTAGQGRRVDAGGETAVAIVSNPASFVQPEQFARWVGASASNLLDSWRAFNEQLSRDPSLMLFYTFDDQDQSVIRNHAVRSTGLYDLQYNSEHGPGWIAGRRPDIPALDFDASKKQYLILPDGPITQTGQITGCVWVKIRSYVPYGSIIKNWGNTKCGVFHLGIKEITHDLEIQLDGNRAGGPSLRDPHAAPLGEWIHVAFVSDGKTLRLYRDGKEVAACPSREIQSDPPVRSLAIGCKTDDDGLSPLAGGAVGFWDGQIGEMALFNRALAPQEIERMSEMGRP
jgi:hypothetical protein